MGERFAELLERYFNIQPELTLKILNRVLVGMAATVFVLLATITVSFDTVFSYTNTASLQIGNVPSQDITAPNADTFESAVLTQQARQEARDSVAPVYDPPDVGIARQQTQLARQVMDFINNVRRDSFATLDEQVNDINQITTLTLHDEIIRNLLRVDNDTWKSIDEGITDLLDRTMQRSIRPNDLSTIRAQLPNQAGSRFNQQQTDIIAAIVEDLVQPNTFQNESATEQARQDAADLVPMVSRTFERGQTVASQGEPITEATFEALEQLGLLTPDDLRLQNIGRALLASIIVMVVIGLYIARFEPQLIYLEPRFLMLLAGIFLLFLVAVRLLIYTGSGIYVVPTTALALLFVTISSPRVAFISSVGLALLVGLMMNNSLEVGAIVAIGGIIGTLALRRPERLNSFFAAGLLVGLMNTALIAVFKLGVPGGADEATVPMLTGFLNGVLIVPATAFALMYMVTVLFNLPTPFKIVELSQPNRPLLQRLLREAPGTYQHSLQVANLGEQAANAIGADAQLTHVAALYHDIGKMVEPIFFSENQQNINNPHDTLNDPYRSASVIISHVTEGDEMAKQYRLPSRIRDFIREHHGTTQVYVFYQRAVQGAGGDTDAVDIADFTYPGPKPRSRETAILMLADSCESAIRAVKPQSRQEISDLVHSIIDSKRKQNQLDDSNLTFNDLKRIESIFIDILQTLNHPRVDYRKAVSGTTEKKARKDTTPKPPKPPAQTKTDPKPMKPVAAADAETVSETAASKARKTTTAEVIKSLPPKEAVQPPAEDDEAPMPEVPPLPRAKRTNGGANGTTTGENPKVSADSEVEKND